jgi:hypothetical protein
MVKNHAHKYILTVSDNTEFPIIVIKMFMNKVSIVHHEWPYKQFIDTTSSEAWVFIDFNSHSLYEPEGIIVRKCHENRKFT